MASIIFSAKDIFEQEFGREVRGYSKAEVDEFLDDVIKDYETYAALVKSLRQEIADLKEELSRKPQVRCHPNDSGQRQRWVLHELRQGTGQGADCRQGCPRHRREARRDEVGKRRESRGRGAEGTLFPFFLSALFPVRKGEPDVRSCLYHSGDCRRRLSDCEGAAAVHGAFHAGLGHRRRRLPRCGLVGRGSHTASRRITKQ